MQNKHIYGIYGNGSDAILLLRHKVSAPSYCLQFIVINNISLKIENKIEVNFYIFFKNYSLWVPYKHIYWNYGVAQEIF